MRKYLQITIVLLVFGLFVLLKQVRGSEALPSLGISVQLTNPSASSNPVQNTPTPTLVTAKHATLTSTSSNVVAQTPTPTIIPTPASNGMMGNKMMGQYRNGTYTGSVEDAYYGNIQVQAIVSGGKLTDVIFLQHPSDNSTSQSINDQAMPLLKQEAIQAQSAQVNMISGASATSPAFQASLANALAQAK